MIPGVFEGLASETCSGFLSRMFAFLLLKVHLIFLLGILVCQGYSLKGISLTTISRTALCNAMQGSDVCELSITRNFITNLIDEDIANGLNNGRVLTRFPPEPNGYLHLGHAKSILFNFGVAAAYKGATNMRFDDTNPEKEETEYVEAIKHDVCWLVTGDVKANSPPWSGSVRHASDYFDTMYAGAELLIQAGKAYVDELSAEEMREYRGTLTQPGKNSPFRERSIEENLHLFRRMRSGELPDGTCILRAKIDMSSPNMNLRDPALYRIKHADHPMTGSKWPIYPMYDYAHALSDAIEGITHSLCTLEFADHRPLYDWVIDSFVGTSLLSTCQVMMDDSSWQATETQHTRCRLTLRSRPNPHHFTFKIDRMENVQFRLNSLG